MKKDLQKFYKNKKVFITGHTGFKGCWLSLLLKELGAKIYGFSLPPYDRRGNMFNITKLDSHIESTFGDIRNFNNLQKTIQKIKPDIVFHLAAQPLVRPSYLKPLETYEINIMGTANLLEACKNINTIKSIVIITTDKCYQNNETGKPFKENDKLGGHDPYSSSKACTEIVSAAYRSSFLEEKQINLATVRAGNVIGGGDFADDRIIPDIFESIEKNKKLFIRSPNAVRPWQHVLEPLLGYITLGCKLYNSKNYTSAYNFSPNKSEHYTVLEITEKFIELIGKGSFVIDEKKANMHEAQFLRLDNSKARKELDWKPLFDFNETIEFTAKWYAEYLSKTDMYNFTLKQINQYLET